MRSDNPSNSNIGLSSLWTQVYHEEDTMTEDSVEEGLLRLENDLRQLSPSVVQATEETMERMDEAVREICDLRMGTLILPEAEDDDDEEEEEEEEEEEAALSRDAVSNHRGEEIRAWTPFWREAAVRDETLAPQAENPEGVSEDTEDYEDELQDLMVMDEASTRALGTRLKDWMQVVAALCSNCVRAVVYLCRYCCGKIKAGASCCFTSFGAGVSLLSNNSVTIVRSVMSHVAQGVTRSYERGQDLATHAMEAVLPSDSKVTQTIFGGLCLGLAAALVFAQWPQSLPSPKDDLREFVTFEKSHNVVDLKEIEDLNTEAFRTFARSTCVETATFEQARKAVSMGLYGVPEAVREDIVRMSVIEGVTQKNSVQDSTGDFVEQGKADTYMAFWSTVYNPSDKLHAYKTCLMVTGVTVTVAETIAEWTTKTERYQVGTEPCHCGYLYCEICPVFDTREVQWPIFERRSLSLRKQEELRRWMVDRAIQSAEHLLLGYDSNKALGDSESEGKIWNPVQGLTWTGGANAHFFGEYSHQEDRPGKSSKKVVYPKTKAEFQKQEL